MEKILQFLNSGLFGNILAIIGLVIAFIPQKDPKIINNSNIYYYERNTTITTKNTTNSSEETIWILIKSFTLILVAYILYTFLHPYFSIILLVLELSVIIRYKCLGIAFVNQMILPVLLIVTTAFLPNFLPNEVLTYWNHAYKINFNQVGTLSKVFHQLTFPILEIKNLFTNILNPLSIAVIANIFYIILATTIMISDLFRSKYKIKISKLSHTFFGILPFIILIFFMFYTDPNSLAQQLVKSISEFLTN
ncbi:TPA: hypothetical protein ACWLYH_001185 [Enterococcus faecalis]